MGSVSHSEAASYLTCRRKHYYGYTLGLTRNIEAPVLALGTAVHAVLETFYQVILDAGDNLAAQQAQFDTALEAAEDKVEELYAKGWKDVDDRRVPMRDILLKWYFPNERFVRNGWRILAVEKEFNLEYDSESESRFPFIVDLITLDPSGKTVIVDHKTVWDFFTDEASQMQPQVPKYIGALRALNYKIDYGVYNMLRTRKIRGTKNKDGSYPGPTLEQMVGTIDLKPNGTKVANTFIEQMNAAAEIQALKDLTPEEQSQRALRTLDKDTCGRCDFKDLCFSELNGGNTKLMLKTQYKPRERRRFDEISEEA